MKALIYGVTTLVVIVIGMNVASNMAQNASEEIVEKQVNKYESLEKQLSGN